MSDKTAAVIGAVLAIIVVVIGMLLFGYVPDINDTNGEMDDNLTDMNGTMENTTQDDENVSLDEFDGVVRKVDDGDTIDVERPNGTIETIRIYGIDTPETSSFGASPSEFGVSEQDSECLIEHGKEAKNFAEDKMLGKKVHIIESPVNRGDFDRKLRYIETNESDKLYGKMVISEGLSRIYDDQQDFPRIDEYEELEDKAKVQNKGLWDCSKSTSDLSIYQVQPDSSGTDTEVPTEFVEIGNTGNETIRDIKISDDTDKSTTIPSIKPNETIEIHTCEASDMRDYVWEYCSAVWNNNGDVVSLTFESNSLSLAY